MEFISKELAIKLNKKGFNKPCFGEYRHSHDNFIPFLTEGNGSFEELLQYSWFIPAPTIAQTLKWLREEKNIYVNVNALPSICKNFMIELDNRLVFDVRVSSFEEETFYYHDLDVPYPNYEDACIAGIEYVINNLI